MMVSRMEVGVRNLFWACVIVAACGGSPVEPTPSSPPGVTPSPSPAPAPAAPSTGGSARLNDDFGGRQLYPSDNWWNQEIAGAPVDPQSSAYIDFIGRTRTAHPDFGPPPYGIPYVGVGGTDARVPVTFIDYGSESDAGFRGVIGYPIPDAAKTQPNFIEGGVPGGGADGDRHLLTSIATRGRCTSCSRRNGTRRAVDGKPDRAPCSICRRTRGVRRVGRRRTRRVSRFCLGSSATTKRCAGRSATRCARPSGGRTTTCGRRRIARATRLARCRWARGCG